MASLNQTQINLVERHYQFDTTELSFPFFHKKKISFSTTTRLKVPAPLSEEGFYFRHYLLFNITTLRGPEVSLNSAQNGFVYLTTKRLIFIADNPTPTFESLSIILENIYSFRFIRTHSSKELGIIVVTSNCESFKIVLEFKENERPRSLVFTDYLKMILETNISKKREPLDTPVTLNNVTLLSDSLFSSPPSYNESTGTNHDHEIISSNPPAYI